jgi:murein L,D-transpeptidase YafK
MLAAAAWGQCPERLPEEYLLDERSQARLILVIKDEYLVGVYEHGALRLGSCFTAAMGPAAQDGPKRARGDMRTPEGWYAVAHRNPNSTYHLSLGLNYPNGDDVFRGLVEGTIDNATADRLFVSIDAGRLPPQTTALGGNIFIHGNPSRFVNSDWTWGCVAVGNSEMDELYRLGDPGTPVLIVPYLPREPLVVDTRLPAPPAPLLEGVRAARAGERNSAEP